MFRISKAKLVWVIVLGVCFGLFAYFILPTRVFVNSHPALEKMGVSIAANSGDVGGRQSKENASANTIPGFEALVRVLDEDRQQGFPMLNLYLSLLAEETNLSLERQPLRGIKAIHVLVESLKPNAEETGLKKERLKTIAELRLRRAGIQVVDTAAPPYVYINVNSLRMDLNFTREGVVIPVYIFDVSVSLWQSVRLTHDLTISRITTTWDRSQLGFISVTEAKQEFREKVESAIALALDDFINDYLAANPVKQ